MDISLDRQVVNQHCSACATEFVVVRGSIFDGTSPRGLYLLALHGHIGASRLGHLAIALLSDVPGDQSPVAVVMDVIPAPDQFCFSLVNGDESPWASETYLGVMLDRDQALASPRKADFFAVASRIIQDLPEARAYFA
jgi:hypothetical protein